jgi:hypothetical protein
MPEAGPYAVVPGVYERALDLVTSVVRVSFAPFRTVAKLGLAATFAAGFAAGAAPGLTLGIALVLAFLLAYAIAAAVILRDAQVRAAMEIYLDHDRIEEADWRLDTGTKRPRGRVAAERWLREHPDSPNRVSTLVLLGRFEEADAELARRPPTTPDERFLVVSDAQYRIMFTGGMPDLSALRQAWEAIGDPRQRHHRRECLALQEAQAAVAAGDSPVECLARAMPEVGGVQPRVRVWVQAARPALFVLLVSVTGLLARQFFAPY